MTEKLMTQDEFEKVLSDLVSRVIAWCEMSDWTKIETMIPTQEKKQEILNTYAKALKRIDELNDTCLEFEAKLLGRPAWQDD